MDRLLEYMTKKITVTDFMQLSRPDTCKKYALFLTNSIHRMFYELQIAPAATPHGVIYFRSLKELGDPSPQEDIERQSLCLTISYFYTRIFQIYGALALTLVDDITYMRQTQAIDVVRGPTLAAPGYLPTAYYGGSCQTIGSGGAYAQKGGAYAQKGRASGGAYAQKGGAYHPTDEPGSFGFLERILDPLAYSAELGGYKTRQQIANASIYFTAAANEGAFRIHIGQQLVGRLILRVRQEGPNTDVTVASLLITSRGVERATALPSDIIATHFVVTYHPGTMEYRINDRSVDSFFGIFLNRLVPYVKRLHEAAAAVAAPVALAAPSDRSEASIPDPLRISRIHDNLKNKRPLGHCIARGLQLLRSSPFPDGTSTSSICKAKFLEATSSDGRTRLSRSGIPEPGTSLDQSPGINALAMLFYDTVLMGNQQLQISDAAKKEYYDFIRIMALRFGDTEVLKRTPETMLREGMVGIKNRRDRELCDQMPGPRDTDVPVRAAVLPAVQARVAELFQRQLHHAAACGKIFQALFNLQRNPQGGMQISLSTGLIRGGFAELNKINAAARQVLVQYYEDCETIYLQGMKTVIDSQRAVPEPGVPLQAQAQPQAQPQARPPPQARPMQPVMAQLQARPTERVLASRAMVQARRDAEMEQRLAGRALKEHGLLEKVPKRPADAGRTLRVV